MKNFCSVIALLLIMVSTAQNKDASTQLPFYELPEASEHYTAGTVAARQVEALGFRFYHASDGLTEKDLAYKPNEEARTSLETIQHIYDLSLIVLNSTLKKPNIRDNKELLSYLELRAQTLKNLQQAAAILKASDDISQFKIIFGEREIPYWNTINGPISDAIWHCGQLASFRRITDNPINSKVNHFTGTVKE